MNLSLKWMDETNKTRELYHTLYDKVKESKDGLKNMDIIEFWKRRLEFPEERLKVAFNDLIPY